VWHYHDPDKDGLIQEKDLGGFLQDYWGFNPGEFANKYWKAVNAYNKDYEGIMPEDFVECWILFDERGMDFFKEPEVDQEKPYSWDVNQKDRIMEENSAENFGELGGDIIKDIKNHWKSKPRSEQSDFMLFIRRFERDQAYQNKLYRRILSLWGKHDKDGDGLLKEDELSGFHKDIWGFDTGDWGKKQWRLCNAYNKHYQGIKPQDFLEVWIMMDNEAIGNLLATNKSDSE